MVRVPRAARRSNSAHVPEHEWRQVQKYIERLYLDEDKGAKHITQALRQEHRLQVTERQLKTRLRIWGYDNKKIPGLLYRAMGYVMEQLGHEVTFKAILLNDRKTRILPAAEVRKEVRRQKREYQPEWHNLQTALDRLQRHKITVVNQRAPPTTTVIANQQPTSDNLHRDLPDETDSDDSNSTMSWDSLPEERSRTHFRRHRLCPWWSKPRYPWQKSSWLEICFPVQSAISFNLRFAPLCMVLVGYR